MDPESGDGSGVQVPAPAPSTTETETGEWSLESPLRLPPPSLSTTLSVRAAGGQQGG